MLMQTATEEQKRKYLEPYASGEAKSAIAIYEPGAGGDPAGMTTRAVKDGNDRSEEHTSEIQSLMRISYAVVRLKKTNYISHNPRTISTQYIRIHPASKAHDIY